VGLGGTTLERVVKDRKQEQNGELRDLTSEKGEGDKKNSPQRQTPNESPRAEESKQNRVSALKEKGGVEKGNPPLAPTKRKAADGEIPEEKKEATIVTEKENPCISWSRTREHKGEGRKKITCEAIEGGDCVTAGLNKKGRGLGEGKRRGRILLHLGKAELPQWKKISPC